MVRSRRFCELVARGGGWGARSSFLGRKGTPKRGDTKDLEAGEYGWLSGGEVMG